MLTNVNTMSVSAWVRQGAESTESEALSVRGPAVESIEAEHKTHLTVAQLREILREGSSVG